MLCALVTFSIVVTYHLFQVKGRLTEVNNQSFTRTVELENRMDLAESRVLARIAEIESRLDQRISDSEDRQDRRLQVISDYIDKRVLNHKDGKYFEKRFKKVYKALNQVAQATSNELEGLNEKIDTDVHEVVELIANMRYGDPDEDEGGTSIR